MANKASAQATLIDLTDGYSVILTNESHTFLGTTTTVDGTQSTTTIIQALCGNEVVNCAVGSITTPNGISVVSDGKTPRPTLTITATSALTTGGTLTIPVIIGDITINKTFSYSIAFKGNTGATGATGATGKGVSNVTTYYLTTNAASGVTTSTSGWATTPTATTTTNKYMWMYQKITYTSGSPTNTTPAIISTHGATGSQGATGATGNGISSVISYYLTTNAASGVTTSTSGWSITPTATTTSNKYIWSYQKITFTNGTSSNTTPAIIGTHGATGATGATGAAGKDAIAIAIESSGGFIFKNSAIATTLTAKVYKGGVEMTGSNLTALGTIKWYKDGGSTAAATGTTLTVAAGDVTNSASYTAQLEG